MKELLFSLSHKIGQFATTRNILILLACWIGFQVILANASAFIQAESQGTNVIDLALPFSFSAEEAYSNYMDKYSPAARAFYLKVECLDLLYPRVPRLDSYQIKAKGLPFMCTIYILIPILTSPFN